MKLHKIEIPKSELLKIPEDERIFFVQLTNLLNDIIILRKLIYFSAKERKDDIMQKAQNSQGLSLIRMQAGKLWEGWKLLQSDFFSAKVSREYEKSLDGLAKTALQNIKTYFSKESLIKLIRNEFAFHYSSDKIKKLITEAPDEEVWEVFLSGNHFNCLYFISHVAVNSAILKSINAQDIDDAMDKLLAEINKVTLLFCDFLGGCVMLVLKRYESLEIKRADIEIPEPPQVDSIDLPYFISED